MNIDNLIVTDDIDKNKQTDKGTNFEKLKRKMQGICASINRSTDTYNPNKTIHSISNYLLESDRLLYSEISGYFFSLDEKARGNFMSNLECLLIECMKDGGDEKIKKIALKIYDHVHLASYQINTMQVERQGKELTREFAQQVAPLKKKLEGQIQNVKKELYSQLIALIGIFTAMAFLIFGGISSLDSVFSNLSKIPLSKVVIVSCIWGICLLDLIFIFVFFVSKMTRLGLGKRCYLLVAIANVGILFILACSIWFYYIKSIGSNQWINVFVKDNEECMTMLGFLLIFFICYKTVKYIIKIYNWRLI